MTDSARRTHECIFRVRYVDELVRLFPAVDPAVEKAFRAVDRADFVSGFFVRQGARWSWLTAGRPLTAEAAGWIYANRPLVTVIGLNGAPASSSSMPGLMMAMLDALAVEEGMRVLEIGTGTGYNAALLARLAGASGHVVTIETDSELAATAAERLGALGFTTVDVVGGDGADGHLPGAPYDRLVATAGCRVVPGTWWDQLSGGGRALVPLSHGATYPLTELVPEPRRGSWTGRLAGPTNFMGATGAGLGGDVPPYEAVRLPAAEAVAEEDLGVEPDRLADLFFFAGLDVPDARAVRLSGGSLGRKLVAGLGLPATEGAALLCGTSLYVGGTAHSAADRLRKAVEHWHSCGRPALGQYRLRLGPPGGPRGDGHSWRFRRGPAEQVVELAEGR